MYAVVLIAQLYSQHAYACILLLQVGSTCSSSSNDSSIHAASSRPSYHVEAGHVWPSTPQSRAAAASSDTARGLAYSSSSSRRGARGAWRIPASKTEGSSSSSSSSSSRMDPPAGGAPGSQEQEPPPTGSQPQPHLADMPSLFEDGSSNNSSSSREADTTEEPESLPVRAALAMLNFYRSSLSPLMQSTCRWVWGPLITKQVMSNGSALAAQAPQGRKYTSCNRCCQLH
jgi:hypothetical protein